MVHSAENAYPTEYLSELPAHKAQLTLMKTLANFLIADQPTEDEGPLTKFTFATKGDSWIQITRLHHPQYGDHLYVRDDSEPTDYLIDLQGGESGLQTPLTPLSSLRAEELNLQLVGLFEAATEQPETIESVLSQE